MSLQRINSATKQLNRNLPSEKASLLFLAGHTLAPIDLIITLIAITNCCTKHKYVMILSETSSDQNDGKNVNEKM